MTNFIKVLWPIVILICIWGIFFYPVWLQNKTPMPADLIVGAYYPWYDYKWGEFAIHVPVKNPLLSDVPSLIYPLRLIAVEMLKGGVLPLWNPYTLNGYPLFGAFQSAILNPLNIVYLFFNFVDGWSVEVSLQIIIAMVFMYIYLKNLSLRKTSALFGSIAYGLCGFNVFWMEYNIHTFVASLIPLLLFFVDKYISSSKLIYLVFFSFGIAIQIFGGFPQITMYTLVILFFYAGFKLNLYQRKNIKKFLLVNISILLGLCLAAIQLLPGLELISYSQRLVEKVNIDSRLLKPEQLVYLAVPDYFGNPATNNFWGFGDYTSAVGYSGAITLAIAIISIFKIKRKEVFFFWVVSATTLFLIVNNPISKFLTVSIFDELFKGLQASVLNKALILINLSLAVLGAFGIEIFSTLSNLKNVLRLFIVPSVLLVGLLVLSYLHHSPDYTIAFRNTFVSTVFVLSAIFIVILSSIFKKIKSFAPLVICLFLTVELLRYGWKITPFVDKSFVFPTTPVIDFLKSQKEPFRILGGNVISGNMWVSYNLSSPDGYESIYPLTTAQLLSSINDTSVDAAPLGKFGTLRNYNSRLIDLMNSTFVLSLKVRDGIISEKGSYANSSIPDKFKFVFEDRSVAVLKNTSVLPRAFVVTEWEVVDKKREVLNKLLAKDFPVDKKILLEHPFNTYPQSGQNTSQVEYIKFSPNEQTVKVQSQNPGFLFISDTWYPGWKAYVDGKVVPILVADYTFRAIPVDKGDHIVNMSYKPQSFEKGKWISFATIAILFTIAGLSARKKYKSI